MGGVCPCLAGVEQAAAKPAAAPAEKEPLLPKAAPKTSPAPSEPAPAKKTAPPPAAPAAPAPAPAPAKTEPKTAPPPAAAAAPAQASAPAPAKEAAAPAPAPAKTEPKTSPPPAAAPAPVKAAAAPATAPAKAPETAAATQEAARSEPAPKVGNDATMTVQQAAEAQQLGIGSCLEVYSNSFNEWCPGVIYGIDSMSVLVAYQVPGEPADANISTKTLPIDTVELRMPTETGAWLTASVEVYSHSNKAWCLGKVTEINDGILSVVFFYPNEPPDAVPVMKQLPLGDTDLRLRGIDAAFDMPSAGLGHETLQISSAVEVFSNSLGVWCPGIVQELSDSVATVAFYYPDMDPTKEEPAIKDLPFGHQDLRVPGYGPAHNTGAPVTEADCVAGAEIEVFSQSRQCWILAAVKEVIEGNVTLQLRYPDMPVDSDLYEKILPIGHLDMRLPGKQSPQAQEAQ